MAALLLALLAQTEAEIDRAVRKGVEAVKAAGQDELALWTLLHAEVPENDPAVRGLLGALQPPASTRGAALQAMIFEDLERVRHVERIALAAQLIVDAQCRDGLWEAGRAVEPPVLVLPPPAPRPPPAFGAPPAKPPVRAAQVLKKRTEGAETGDPAHARWALGGLLAAHHAGIRAPAEVVERAAAAWRREGRDAADVVSCLSICRYLQGKDHRKDPDVLKALELLAAEKRSEPAALYGLERAMMLYGSDRLGGALWYPRDAALLIGAQRPDGTWGSLEDTCYATLALHKRKRRCPDCPDRKK